MKLEGDIFMKNIFWLITVLLVGCDTKDISKSDVASAEKLAGLTMSVSERDSLLSTVNQRVEQYRSLRESRFT